MAVIVKEDKKILVTPISREDLKDIHIGDIVYLSGDSRQCLHEERNACDASVDDVIRDQEKIEPRRVDGCPHGQPDGFLELTRKVDMPME